MFSRGNSLLLPLRVAQRFDAFKGTEKGAFLVEALMALALVGIVAVGFLSGLATASEAALIADKGATAESLARSQVEYVKSQAYIDYADPGHGNYELIAAPAGYTVEITVLPIDPDTGQPLPSGQDDGIQKITAIVEHDGRQAMVLDSYKVNR